ncbi:RNA polymerase sporulation sigma factor SigK [Oscillospiraceae bacterium LCP25S3_E3]|nr:RNA polymerase sporulation sigma factor SigK [Ruminococcus sp.]MDY2855763.1 RNA polymerase sporulation sigma factor SigK [Oscillospiraceae bacterium]
MFFEILNGMYMFFILHLTSGNVYPKPLSAADEKKYLARVAQGDKEARNILVEHNLRLVAHIVKKYYTGTNDYDDLLSVGVVGLIKAINTFDATKTQRLSSYASICIQNEILMMFRNNKKAQQEISLSESVDSDKDGNNLVLMDVIAVDDDIVEKIDTKFKSEKLQQYINEELDEREKTVIELRYGLNGHEEKTQREIAAMLNISRSYISRIETKALKKLRRRYDKG